MRRALAVASLLLGTSLGGCEGVLSNGPEIGAGGGKTSWSQGGGRPTGGGSGGANGAGGAAGGGVAAEGGGGGDTSRTLTMKAEGSGATDPAVGSHAYPVGAKVAVKAVPGTGATFTGWSGAASGTTTPLTITLDADKELTATFSTSPRPTTFTNPVLWEDLADIDIIRVDDTFYYSASNMHYSPGAPILRSYDLVNWEYAGHSVPVLDFGPAYDLNGGRAYVRGTWASSLNYRKSNKTFYWLGCIDGKTRILTASSVEGPWQEHPAINNCYYDAGLLIDDDDTMYVAYGTTTIRVAQLSADGFSEVKNQAVFTNSQYIEGSRFYKIKGTYYILVTQPASAEHVLKSSGGPFGPYTIRPLVQGAAPPVPGAGNPHQGGIVQTQNDDWYYMAFIDAYPGGRVPVLAPITWSADGWPTIDRINQGWAATYPFPNVPPSPRVTKPPTGRDTFSETTLGPEWEWNHNPDNSKWSSGSGLTLQTATVTNDLYSARNTLTHRILGPTSTATIELDSGNMKDGDRAGLVLLRDSSAWVGVKRDAGAYRLAMVSQLTMDKNWNTTGTGSEVAGTSISGGRIWLRLAADIHPGAGKTARFSYSTDGTNFTSIGSPFVMGNDWAFFPGHRFGIFNYATQSLGGSVKVAAFDLASP